MKPSWPTVKITDFLTDEEITRIIKKWNAKPYQVGFAKWVAETIIEPNMERINTALGQQNHAMFLGYMVEHACVEAMKHTVH